MKILLRDTMGEPMKVYHTATRVIDHYKAQIIAIIENKNEGSVDFAYDYKRVEIERCKNELTGIAEILVTYTITSKLSREKYLEAEKELELTKLR